MGIGEVKDAGVEKRDKKIHHSYRGKQGEFCGRPSEVLAYLGPNGAGKSTTIKMLTGLLEPTDGEIYYQGRNIKDNLYEYKKRVGYGLPTFFPLQ